MKVSIVGIGKVGSALGLTLIARGIVDELVLIGRNSNTSDAPIPAVGEAMDLLHASAFTSPAQVSAGRIADAAGSDVIVICIAGGANHLPRESGYAVNAEIFSKSFLNL